MKKIFTLLVTVISFNVSFGQNSWSYKQENNRPAGHGQSVTDPQWSYNHNQPAGNNHYNYKQNDDRHNDYERQKQIDQINKECDQRIYSYRHDRSINNYERNRRIREVESERSVRIGSFGTGAIIGVTAGLILGVILSH